MTERGGDRAVDGNREAWPTAGLKWFDFTRANAYSNDRPRPIRRSGTASTRSPSG